jgi:hypothetical protein
LTPGSDPESASSSLRGLRFGGLVILFVARGGPRRGIGGGPVHHAELNKYERLAGPSVPSFATPNSWFDLTPRFSQRAERRQRAHRLRHALSSHQRAAVQLIETDSMSGFFRTFDDRALAQHFARALKRTSIMPR